MTNEPRKRTITLSGRAPVTIREEEWPIIAVAKAHDGGEVESQAARTWALRVRQHADGRRIVYGMFDSACAGERSLRAGELLDPDADLPAAISRVAADCDCREIAQPCIAALPPVEL